MSFRYTEAIVCRLPDDLPPSVDLKKCRREFEEFITVLRDTGVDVLELPPPEQPKQSPFVGDMSFVINGMGVIRRPMPHEEEVTTMIRTVLKKELGIPVVEVNEEGVLVQGGDVLFTGKELFVGLSKYTNEAGALFLANVFPELPCSPIMVPGDKQLTYFVNMASPDVICVRGCTESQDVIKRIESKASFPYETITMPNDHTAEVLNVNGTLIHLTSEEKIFSEKLMSLLKRPVEMEELPKLSVNFARLTILLNKSLRSKSYV